MLTLSLLRHAKSSWDDETLDDFARPLSPRGEDAAPRMAAFLAERGVVPELILCSSAIRTRQTVALALPLLKPTPRVVTEDSLYLAPPATLLKHIRAVETGIGHVMVVGHNPGLHTLAVALAGSGAPAERQALKERFPTAALAVLTFPFTRWSNVRPDTGRLVTYTTPRQQMA